MTMTMAMTRKTSGGKMTLTTDGGQGTQRYGKQKYRRMPDVRNHPTNLQ